MMMTSILAHVYHLFPAAKELIDAAGVLSVWICLLSVCFFDGAAKVVVGLVDAIFAGRAICEVR